MNGGRRGNSRPIRKRRHDDDEPEKSRRKMNVELFPYPIHPSTAPVLKRRNRVLFGRICALSRGSLRRCHVAIRSIACLTSGRGFLGTLLRRSFVLATFGIRV